MEEQLAMAVKKLLDDNQEGKPQVTNRIRDVSFGGGAVALVLLVVVHLFNLHASQPHDEAVSWRAFNSVEDRLNRIEVLLIDALTDKDQN